VVIHNMSQALQQDVLREWDITDHFRFPAPR
jgi:hypothetical protein